MIKRTSGRSNAKKRPISKKRFPTVVFFCYFFWHLLSLSSSIVLASAWVGSSQMECKRVPLKRKPAPLATTWTLQRKRTILGMAAADDPSLKAGHYLENLLHRHGYGQRIITLSSDELPVLAEMYDHGQWELCTVTGFKASGNNEWTPPRVEVQLISNELDTRTIDFGQITTIWDVSPRKSLESWQVEAENETDKFPVQHGERAMQRLYQSRAGPPRKAPSSALSKKQVTKLVAEAPDVDSRAHIESVLRKVVKTGAGMSKLADSYLAMDYLYNDYPRNSDDSLRRRIAGAHILAEDAELGGRFKRMPCTFVSADYKIGAATKINSVTLVNGGWLAVDQSVRAGTEARKFAKRAENTTFAKAHAPAGNKVQLLTAADERIAQRLESLAMGELVAWEGDVAEDQQEEMKLEVDVREALKAMGLLTTPEGAQEALLRIGRWSQKPNQVRLQPWPQPVLDAARWFAELDKTRRSNLYKNSSSVRGTQTKGGALEGRTDLTMLPCVCVDAKRTSFRDDAIGVRPRSITGRKVVTDASKYEILIHIADVSDIYAPEPFIAGNAENLRLLREAAEKRGMSRYDLPLGPLHLMPPAALKVLSLETTNVDLSSTERDRTALVENANRCVTLWAYIDERTGKVIDAGLERTLISAPISLSFVDATYLLEGKLADSAESEHQDHILKKGRAILSVVERNLLLWNTQHLQSNEAARKRETRLSVKELVAKEMKGSKTRDDGRDGFQRTRGHKLVDIALTLYGYGVSSLLRRAYVPVPIASGSGASRGGRVATAPLRRYIDGVAQRQALSVLCGYGGPPLTKQECMRANKAADKANSVLSNIRAAKEGNAAPKTNIGRQQNALRLLQADLSGKDRSIPAMSTGRENEVVILGVGAVAKCKGVKGSLKPGARVLVKVRRIDAAKGVLSVSLVQEGRR